MLVTFDKLHVKGSGFTAKHVSRESCANHVPWIYTIIIRVTRKLNMGISNWFSIDQIKAIMLSMEC